MAPVEAAAAPARTMDDNLLVARALRKRYGPAHWALDDVSFTLRQGGVVALLGPNGAGKTTCLRLITGYLQPTSGEVRLRGLDVQRDGPRARRALGYLPEAVPLYPELRVDEYLRFRARLKRVGSRQLAGELERVQELCGIGEVRRRIVGQLSRGYRQRVGLADALLGAPALLVLDEPTAGLDPNQIREVRELLRRLARVQTVLLSTHILGEVEAVCDRVLILDHGRLVADGAVEDVCRARGDAHLSVEIRGPLASVRDALSALAGVAQVEVHRLAGAEDLARYRLRGRLDDRGLEQLTAVVADRGWTLRELRRERGRLEDLFARLTRPEALERPDA